MKIVTIALTLMILIGLTPLLSANNEVKTGWCNQSDLIYASKEEDLTNNYLGCATEPKSPEQVSLDLLIKIEKLGMIDSTARDIAIYKLRNAK